MPSLSSSRRALIAFAAAFAASPSAGQAQTACAPAAPVAGDEILCSGSGEGLRIRDLAGVSFVVDATARIDGVDGQAFRFGNDVVFTNSGELTGRDDHAVQGGNDVTVVNRGLLVTQGDGDGINIDDRGQATNSGRIEAADDGIQVEADSVVINHGVIISADKGIQGAAGSQATNHGEIRAGSEGIEINEEGAVIVNHGSIHAVDDGINVGENATITNTGLILVSGPQDGIDLDSGLVVNSGQIRATGGEDGIDFDPSPDASRIVNSGLIEGAHGVYADPADEGAQTIENSGVIRGLGGVAVDLGRGDDRLILLEGSRIEGSIEMGEGRDVVEIRDARPMTLAFGSAPEEVISALPSLFSAGTLVQIDPAPLSTADHMAGSLAQGLTRQVLAEPRAPGLWISGTAGRVSGSVENGRDHDGSRFGAILGYEAATAPGGISWGGWLALSQAEADLDDDLHEVTQKSAILGLDAGWSPDPSLRLGATAFLGLTRTDLDSPAAFTGSGEADGVIYGLAARGDKTFIPPSEGGFGLALAAEAGWARHDMDGYGLSGLGGGEVGGRDSDALWGRVEAAAPILWSGLEIRPFVAAGLLDVKGDAISYALPGGRTSFPATSWENDLRFGGGVSLSGRVGGSDLSARLEADGEEVSFGVRLNLPFGR